MRSRRMTYTTAVLGLLGACLAWAGEIVVKNDSFQNGGNAVVVGDFIPGEEAGARLTSPCDGAIVAVQIGWLAQNGAPGASLERFIHIYDGATFPSPGAELQLLEAPLLTPGFLNEFRYIDEDQLIPLNVPVTAGQQFYVTLEFDNPTDIANGSASVFRDPSGCTPGGNVLYAIPGGWFNFCVFISGDLVIRAVIECPDPTGACCFADGTCDELTAVDCASAGGTYNGDFTTCSGTTCPEAVQACCFPNTGGCLNLTPTNCLAAGGVPGGLGTNCATYVCFPEGACCLPDGTCMDGLSPDECAMMNGLFQGDGSSCSGVTCPEPEGACCFSTGFCLTLTQGDCTLAGGNWAGPATTCDDVNGNGTADDCEAPTCPGDLTGDARTDFDDFAQLASCWNQPCGDLTGDNLTDFDDFAALSSDWNCGN